MIVRRRLSPLAQALKRLADSATEESPCLSSLQGNPKSPVLLLAPVPTVTELAAGRPWCGEPAKAFFGFLSANSRLGLESFLVMPAVFRGTKPNKQSIAEAVEIFSLLITRPEIKAVVCLGPEPYKVFIGHGKMPTIDNLAGIIIRPEAALFKEVFLLPDPKVLPLRDDYPEKRDYFTAKRISEQCYGRIHAVLPALERFIQC